jgi:hypothetical protein
MDERFNMLSGAILEKPLDQCSVPELEELAANYPYFAPAHYLLLKKKEEAGEDTTGILQKTMMFYHDPVSFGHFIHPQKTDERFLYEEGSKPVPLTPAFVPDPVEKIPVQIEQVKKEEPEPMEQPKAPEEVPTLPEKQLKPETAITFSEKPAEEKLAFEPYHTVDYFASQGIRPSKEEPKDALGKQLKSFTEWLKTMKKLPDAANTVAKPTDPVVEAMATRSVGDTVVVTEAMAEVWLKQGNKERALEIYKKLSLLDPSKSTYFAGKIDNLKAD